MSRTFLFYGCAVDPNMLVALNKIASEQSKSTQKTVDVCKMNMDYAHTYPDAKVRYHKSDMILHCESDAAYLVLPNARSRIISHYLVICLRLLPFCLLPRPQMVPSILFVKPLKALSFQPKLKLVVLFMVHSKAFP